VQDDSQGSGPTKGKKRSSTFQACIHGDRGKRLTKGRGARQDAVEVKERSRARSYKGAGLSCTRRNPPSDQPGQSCPGMGRVTRGDHVRERKLLPPQE